MCKLWNWRIWTAEVASYDLTTHISWSVFFIMSLKSLPEQPWGWATQSPSSCTCFYMLLLMLAPWCSCPSRRRPRSLCVHKGGWKGNAEITKGCEALCSTLSDHCWFIHPHGFHTPLHALTEHGNREWQTCTRPNLMQPWMRKLIRDLRK